jgi:OOP family OmpA-OmpF porin
MVAGEIGYFDFGKSTASVGAANGELKLSGFGVGAAFHADLAPSWTGVARLGVAQMKTKLSAAGLSGSDNNTTLYGGLGVGYRLNKQTTIDGVWDFSKAKFNKTLGGVPIDDSGSVNAFSVGVTFGF